MDTNDNAHETHDNRSHHEKTHVPSDNPMTETDEDGKIYSNVLRVKADPEDISDEERKKRIKSLAGAIAHSLRRFGEVHVRVIGKDCAYKGLKAVIDASAFVAVHGHDLYMRPTYMMANDIQGKDEMTGMSFLIITSQNVNKS